MDLRTRDAFPFQIRVAIAGWSEQPISNLVGEQAVELLGHCPVKRPQSCLDMYHRNLVFGANERRGES